MQDGKNPGGTLSVLSLLLGSLRFDGGYLNFEPRFEPGFELESEPGFELGSEPGFQSGFELQ